ncbi:MAG: PH domain-containing protein [Candidatus Bathyarchaeia archaeon]
MWNGKPVLIPFIFSGISAISTMIGVVWLIFAIFFALFALSVTSSFPISPTIFPLMFLNIILIIVMGVGIILGPLILELLRCRNTEYMITDRRIITQTGVVGIDTRFVDLDKIQEVYVTVGWLDKIFGTGSVVAVTAGYVSVGTPSPYGSLVRPAIKAVSQPYEVQKLLQEAIKKRVASQT